MKRKLLSLSSALSLCAMLLLPQGGFAASPAYELTFSSGHAAIGEEISVTVKGDSLTDLYGYDLDLHFDPSRLEYIGMSSGLTGGYTVAPSPQSDRTIDVNLRQGDILFGYTKTGNAEGVSGDVTLGTIRFKTKAAGITAVKLEQVKLIHSDSKLPAETSEPNMEAQTTVDAGSTGGGGDPGSGSRPTPSPSPNPNSGLVIEFEVKDGKVTVTLHKEHKGAAIPLDKLTGKELTVKADRVTVSIKPEIIAELAGRAKDSTGATVIVNVIPVQDPSQGGKGGSTGTKIKVAGQVYDLQVLLRTADGNEIPAKDVSGGIELNFDYDSSDLDESLLGVYYFNEATGKWEYIGGSVEASQNKVNTALQHLSKYAVLEYDKTYSDVPADHWVYRTVKVLSAKHIVNGMTDEQFHPNGKTTRAEFAALLVRGLGLKTSGKVPAFQDVSANAWFAEDVTAAYSAGLIQGLSETEFMPNAGITREQMAAMLVRAYEYKTKKSAAADNKLQAYSDREAVSGWAQAEVNKAIALGLMQGKQPGVFDPGSDVIRAEMAQAMLNFITN